MDPRTQTVTLRKRASTQMCTQHTFVNERKMKNLFSRKRTKLVLLFLFLIVKEFMSSHSLFSPQILHYILKTIFSIWEVTICDQCSHGPKLVKCSFNYTKLTFLAGHVRGIKMTSCSSDEWIALCHKSALRHELSPRYIDIPAEPCH